MDKFSITVKQAMQIQEMDVETFAKKMKLSVQHTYALLGNRKCWTERTFLHACDILGIEVNYSFRGSF